MTAQLRTEPSAARRVQLLAHSMALRTALRRGLAAARSDYALTAEAGATSDAIRTVGEGRPDAVVLDAELPGLRGLSLLGQIAAADPSIPIVVVVPDTASGRALRAEALEKGATGIVMKPAVDEPIAFRRVVEEIIGYLGRGVPARPALRPDNRSAQRTRVSSGRSRSGRIPPQLLVVASSTGGPQALITLFSGLPPQSVSVPVLIVQHMPAAFTPILAEHLTRATHWRAVEARDDETLTAGEIRIAPGGHHMVVSSSGGGRTLRLTETPPVNFCRPSADVLFVSAAEQYGRGVLAVILTGMGNDGCEGAKVISAAGGTVYAQDRETSVVWGMPGAAVTAGIVDRVFPLGGMAQAVQSALAGAG